MSSVWNGSGDMIDPPVAGVSRWPYSKPEARGQNRRLLAEPHDKILQSGQNAAYPL